MLVQREPREIGIRLKGQFPPGPTETLARKTVRVVRPKYLQNRSPVMPPRVVGMSSHSSHSVRDIWVGHRDISQTPGTRPLTASRSNIAIPNISVFQI